jgi:hypothetical protein
MAAREPALVRPALLRHFCASQLYLNGMDLIAIQEALGDAWVATTMRHEHVHRDHVEQAWAAAQQRAERRLEGLILMRWNLRLTAANRGIWKASERQHLLADHGLVMPVVVVAWQRASAGDRAACAADVSRRSPGGERTPESVTRTRQRQRGGKS